MVLTAASQLAQFSGVAQFPGGTPISGLNLCLQNIATTVCGTTDSGGAFDFAVPENTYTLEVNGDSPSPPLPAGRQVHSQTGAVDLSSGDVTENLTFPASGQLTVSVTGPDGSPVAGTIVQTEGSSIVPFTVAPGIQLSGTLQITATTGSDGTVTVPDWPTSGPVTYSVYPPTASGYNPLVNLTAPALTGNTTLPVQVTGQLAQFSGVAQFPDGTPISGLNLCLVNDITTGCGSTDSGGAFDFAVPENTYTLEVNGDGPSPPLPAGRQVHSQTGAVDLSSGDVTENLTFPASGQLTVSVTGPDGSPVAGTIVQTEGSSIVPFTVAPGIQLSGTLQITATTGSDGTVTVPDWPTSGPVTYSVYPPTASGYNPLVNLTAPALTGNTTLPVQVTGQLAQFSGVAQFPGGTPISGLNLCLQNIATTVCGTTDSGGAFDFAVPENTYTLEVNGDGPSPPLPAGRQVHSQTGAVDLSSGDVTENLTFPASGQLTVSVTGPDGSPVAGTIVQTEGSSIVPFTVAPGIQLSGTLQITATTGSDGTVTVPDWPTSGPVTYSVYPPTASGYNPLVNLTAPALTGNTTLAIQFSPTAATTTTVLASSANPSVAGRQVTYTATVSPVPDGGTVAFTDGGSPIAGCGAQPVDTTTGHATCQTTPGTSGAHNIAATFSGSGRFAGSTSAALTQVVTNTACHSLAGCNLHGLNLTGAKLSGANLSNANLNGANLTGADLSGADLAGANLNGADLSGADLSGADVAGANFNKVTWSDTTCPDGTNSDTDGGTCAGHL